MSGSYHKWINNMLQREFYQACGFNRNPPRKSKNRTLYRCRGGKPTKFYLSLWESQQGRCPYCNRLMSQVFGQDSHVWSEATFDHVIPLSQGGANGGNNVVLACKACNLSKGDKSVETWMATRKIKPERYVDA